MMYLYRELQWTEYGLLSVPLNPKTKDVYKQGHISSQNEKGSQQILWTIDKLDNF